MLFAAALMTAAQERPPAPPTQQPDFETERKQADEAFRAGKALEALPLYEDLEKRDPTRAVFAERHAAGLIAKSATITDPAAHAALLRQAYDELLRAQSLGDNSQYVINQLEHFKTLFSTPAANAAAPPVANPKVLALLQQGEAAFARTDYAAALKAYTAAAEQDPKSYEAALYAGDTAFRLHDADTAGQWFAKAIAINPDLETAYRYWGDALLAANQPDAARDKFIDAVVAQPYSRSSWGGLQQWAQRTHTQLASPRIDRPQPPKDAKTLDIDPALANDDGSGRSAWITYLVGRNTWRNVLFHQKFPEATTYRHTLAEELDCLQHVIEEVKKKNIPPDKLDPSLKVLLTLDASHMLEPWILLHGADQGIAQDYPAFRAAHREQLHAFIAQYDIAAASPTLK